MLLVLLGLGAWAIVSSPPAAAAPKSYPVRPYVYAASTSATTYDVMLADGVSKDRMVAQVKVDSIYFGDVAARLAYDRGMFAFRVSGDRNGGSSLYVVDIKNGKPTQVALAKSKAEGIGAFAWSPAGRTMAYVRSAPGTDPADADLAYGTVYLYSAGYNPVRLGGSNGSDRVLAFSGDGLGLYVARREAAKAGTLEHLAYLPLSGGEATIVMRSQPGLKYSHYAVSALSNEPARIAALAEGDFTLAVAGTFPGKPTPQATPTSTATPTTITSTFAAAASATLAATTPKATATPTPTVPASKVPVAGKLARPSGLGVVVLDPVSSVPYLVRRDAEAFPYVAWAADGKSLLMGGGRSGSAWVVDLEGGRRALGTPLTGLSVLSWSDDGSVAMLSDSPTSKLLALDFRGGKVLASRALGYSKVAAPAVALKVPYIHQVNDTASSGDGNWACGPTSVAMALAYYGKLDPWETVMQGRTGAAAAPSGSTRPLAGIDFAPYVTNVYTNNGHTYSATARDPRGNMLAGLYGTICPTGLASWSAMRSVLEWHGLSATQIAASWDGVVAALKRGHPVLLGNMLTSEGHILLVVGYTQDGNLIVNDPYGNRFAPGYGANNGEQVVYPWKRTTARTAVEVTGIYPPPPRTATPTPTSTVTPTNTPIPTATNTPTAVVTFIAIPDAQSNGGALQQATQEVTQEPTPVPTSEVVQEPTPEPTLEPTQVPATEPAPVEPEPVAPAP
jgi:hypothetical protein